MKYTLQIAFSESVGDLILRIHEYAQKYGKSVSSCINPLFFDFQNNGIEVLRPEKNCKTEDLALYPMEFFSGISENWITRNKSIKLQGSKGIEDFFERQFSNHIIEDEGIDAEMHLLFYVPLYDSNVSNNVRSILENLPKGHKFISNVVVITYDMAWACNMLKGNVDKEQCKENMLQNISELVEMTKLFNDNYDTLLKHIFLFQNYNMNGWSRSFTTKKFIEVCSNLSIILADYYDVVCPRSWHDYSWGNEDSNQDSRPILAINLETEKIDLFLAINHIFRQLFKSEGDDNIIIDEDVDKEKVHNAYKEIIHKEIELISKYKTEFTSGLGELSVYDKLFEKEVKEALKNVVDECIEKFMINVSEQHYLYTLFTKITDKTNFEDDSFCDANWWLEEMVIKELDGDDNLLETFDRLKKCSKELKNTKLEIKEQEAIIEELHKKLNPDYPPNGILTEEGFKIGNEVFKPYTYQEQPMDEDYNVPKDLVIPQSVDLRTEFAEIKNQGSQGSCSAFSLVSVIEYFINKILREKTDLSEAFVYYNARLINNETEKDEGSSFYNIIKSIRDHGVCIESLCPYDPKVFNAQPTEEAYTEAKNRKITEAKNVYLNVDYMKSALAQGLPVVISARAFNSYVLNANGVIPMPDSKDLQDDNHNHAMVVCGYTDKEGYFIVRNSWGENFGDNGYCYLPYEYVRIPNAINNAYVVTGLNIKGFEPGDLPTVDSLLRGKDFNAQYEIYNNMLHETTIQLQNNRERLEKIHTEYLYLFNQIADYSNVELTLEDLEKQTEQQRLILEEKLKQIAENVEESKKQGLFGKIFNRKNHHDYEIEKKKLEEQMKLLNVNTDVEQKKFRVRMAILNGLNNINQEFLAESIKMQDLSDFYQDENKRIEDVEKIEEEELENVSRILPLDNITRNLQNSEISSLVSSLGNVLSRINKGEFELYDKFKDLNRQIMSEISQMFDVKISDHINDDSFERFYSHIIHSSVMAQIYGGVPVGYGDESKYFFCNIEQLPKYLLKETEDVRLLPIKDDLRMAFLHIEKYNIKDFVIFRS